MLTIALTGGIGSGKSAALVLFEKCGCSVISMDAISKQLTEPGQDAYQEIIKMFGAGIVDNDNHIDRAKLATLVFNDTKARHSLEEILHPRIEHAVRNQIQRLRKNIIVIEIPLLLAHDQFDFIDKVLVIESDPEVRIERILLRDKTRSREDITAIINSQIDDDQRNQLADDVLYNNQDSNTLEKNIETLYKKYLQQQ